MAHQEIMPAFRALLAGERLFVERGFDVATGKWWHRQIIRSSSGEREIESGTVDWMYNWDLISKIPNGGITMEGEWTISEIGRERAVWIDDATDFWELGNGITPQERARRIAVANRYQHRHLVAALRNKGRIRGDRYLDTPYLRKHVPLRPIPEEVMSLLMPELESFVDDDGLESWRPRDRGTFGAKTPARSSKLRKSVTLPGK